MSNTLSVRRVKVQTINAAGEPDGPPSFGVMASDDYESAYVDVYESLEHLNGAIDVAGCILGVFNNELFANADRHKVGKANFLGNDWMR